LHHEQDELQPGQFGEACKNTGSRLVIDNRWDEEADLLVAGAGAGGMTAALVARLEGLEVLLCEKSEQVGGTAATSAGSLWIPGNIESRDVGLHDSPDEAEKYLDRLIGEDADRELRKTYLESGPDVLTYLAEHSDVKFRAAGNHPDYRINEPGAAYSGRVVIPLPFDGRLLGRDFVRVRPPIDEFMLLGGMMVGKDDIARLLGRFRSIPNFVHSLGLLARYAVDRLRYPRGTRLVMGNALVARLFSSLSKQCVSLRFECAIKEIFLEAGRVRGALIVQAGRERRVRTRVGVVLATGGFAHNQNYRAAFMPQPTPHRSMAFAGNTGDGVEIGQRLGARISPEQHRSGAFWSPVSIVHRSNGDEGLYPHLLLDRAKPGLIAINARGVRFVNEAVSYHDFVLAMFETNRQVTSIPAYLICDSGFVRKYGLGAIHPGTRVVAGHESKGSLVCENTIPELAKRISVDPVQLNDTVTRANLYAITGRDLDFGKGNTSFDQFNGDPKHGPNPCLGEIRTPPFCALPVWPGEIAVSTGLATDKDAQVLDAHGRPLGGLYACGNDMASIMKGTYPGPGTTLGPAVVFGYRAAMHAAQAKVGRLIAA
jgi:succinate dehydrogenase/fumarate reductase flavoprotein subunit